MAAVARNLHDCQNMPDGAYFVELEIYDTPTQVWIACPYIARSSDGTPVSNWVLAEIATGRYPVTPWVPPAPPPSPTDTMSGSEPSVIG